MKELISIMKKTGPCDVPVPAASSSNCGSQGSNHRCNPSNRHK